MIDLAFGFVGGIVVGHYTPVVYTWIMSFFTKAEATVESATSSTSTTDTTSN
jgi:hypothetical protein